MKALDKSDALLLVDVQNDFLEGGALAVEQGNDIIPVLNHYIQMAVSQAIPVIASRDWHPQDHCSFKTQGGIWPPHCVQETEGAEFNESLKLPREVVVVNKAFVQERDAYSAFEGELATGESLVKFLNKKEIKRLWIGGLALDYCVKATVLDALKNGFSVKLIMDAVKAVDKHSGKAALDEMKKAGVQVI